MILDPDEERRISDSKEVKQSQSLKVIDGRRTLSPIVKSDTMGLVLLFRCTAAKTRLSEYIANLKILLTWMSNVISSSVSTTAYSSAR